MSGTAVIERGGQTLLLDTDTKEIDAYWVDPAQPLKIPVNPLHYTAHKYQLMLERLDLQARRNPAQFNSGNYIAIMEKLENLLEQISKEQTGNENMGSGNMAQGGKQGTAPGNSQIKPISMDS